MFSQIYVSVLCLTLICALFLLSPSPRSKVVILKLTALTSALSTIYLTIDNLGPSLFVLIYIGGLMILFGYIVSVFKPRSGPSTPFTPAFQCLLLLLSAYFVSNLELEPVNLSLSAAECRTLWDPDNWFDDSFCALMLYLLMFFLSIYFLLP